MPVTGGRRNMTKNQRPDSTISPANTKKEERAIREAYRRERKIESYLADDENFPSFSTQLHTMGLQLRDIPGDGNCLFRALGDQLEGHGRNHFKHRQDVVTYMMDHRKDFEPFMEDDMPFDFHISNLKKLGTYAGNDAIVAFARLHQVNIYIHQLNAKPLMIQGCPTSAVPQLHISYHNGDHYSSVRKMNDNTESPANIQIQDPADKDTDDRKKVKNGYVFGQDGFVRAVRGTEAIEAEVVNQTNCQDINLVRQSLIDCHYDVEEAVVNVMQLMEVMGLQDDSLSGTSQATPTDSGIWSENGTGTRLFGTSSGGGDKSKGHKVHFREDSFGGSSGYGSLNSSEGGARPKLAIPKQQMQPSYVYMSGKKMKQMKKMEKKKRAEERHRQKFVGVQPPLHPEPPSGVTMVKCPSITRI